MKGMRKRTIMGATIALLSLAFFRALRRKHKVKFQSSEDEMATLKIQHVCAECFADATLKTFITNHAQSTICTFCGLAEDTPIAVDLVGLLQYIRGCIDRDYDLADNCLMFDSSGYAGDYWYTDDLLTDEIGLSLPKDDGRLRTAIASGIGEIAWCRRNPYDSRRDKALKDAWQYLCRTIKHSRRYFFLDKSSPSPNQRLSIETYNIREPWHYQYGPLDLLNFLEESAIQFSLFRSVKPGTVVYRARMQKDGQTLSTAHDFGPPPFNSALQPNRMSPAGIVMFYGSDDWQTAVAEVSSSGQTEVVAIGKFELERELYVLDLTALPPRPGFFDQQINTETRYKLYFLHDFMTDFSKPLERKGGEHVDYVPTQVVTEWVRTKMKYNDHPLDGIYYPSAQRCGGTSVVLFASRDQIVLSESELRKFVVEVMMPESREFLMMWASNPFFAEDVVDQNNTWEPAIEFWTEELRRNQWLRLVDHFVP